MMHVVLYQPEIAPNSGNIIRLCANTGAQLHLIHPLGFELDDKRLRRAGLDYREWATLKEYPSFEDFLTQQPQARLFACTTHGQQRHTQANFKEGDMLLFGPETRGLPKEIIQALPAEQRLRLPMQADSRSLNLSNAVAIMVYEMWRQFDFSGSQ